jgi:hypothetical protein
MPNARIFRTLKNIFSSESSDPAQGGATPC